MPASVGSTTQVPLFESNAIEGSSTNHNMGLNLVDSSNRNQFTKKLSSMNETSNASDYLQYHQMMQRKYTEFFGFERVAKYLNENKNTKLVEKPPMNRKHLTRSCKQKDEPKEENPDPKSVISHPVLPPQHHFVAAIPRDDKILGLEMRVMTHTPG
ncbi:hypothetical protein JTE90_024309 [Oedothorax gibbosus]|uniref:Uncharacterized protein n=1 Tax=Oedothorax gibbosus TaxID=931172 RepID=A0AAV6W0X4_9ARAC|nr:hypothetical protein JTE90_024309 [Oedothorax gibbosus]